MTIVYVACDHGARAAVEPLLSRVPGKTLLGGTRADERYWQSMLQEARLLICGTSDSAGGRSVEDAARAVASQRSIPQVVIEDFPGNFRASAGPPPSILVTELEAVPSLDKRTTVLRCPGLRYDALRARLHEIRASGESFDAGLVIWAGQPETEACIRTLKCLLPALKEANSRLLFRAHPRDHGYHDGAYDCFLAEAEDATSIPLEQILRRRPGMVVTQFSSVAVEAGFWAIPALHVLLPEAGLQLLERKGYSELPWCASGAALSADAPRDVAILLRAGLTDPNLRRRLLHAFDNHFAAQRQCAPGVVNFLYNQGLL